MLEWTGERYIPGAPGAQIHYEHLHRYALAAQLVKGKKVLDLACGEGYGSYLLAKEAESVIGVEIDDQTVHHANSRYVRANLQFIKGSILDIPIGSENKFDVIICFEGIEHLEDHDKLLTEVKRLLRNSGLFIVSTPNKEIYTDEPRYHNPFHVKELYFNELNTLLRRYFRNVQFLAQKVYTGSNIWDMSSREWSNYQEFAIKKAQEEFCFSESGAKVPLYFVAVASDTSLKSYLAGTSSWLIDVSDIMIKQHQGQIGELSEALQIKESQIKGVAIELESKSNQLKELTVLVQARDSRIKEMENALADWGNKTNELSRAIQARDFQIAEIQSELYRLQRGIVGQFLRRYDQVVEKFLRSGTKRRYYHELGLNGVRIILNEGWRSFWRKARSRFSMRRPAWREQTLVPRVSQTETSTKKREKSPITELSTHPPPVIDDRFGLQIREIETSGLFDAAWYLSQNPDVRNTGVNPLEHYLRIGAAEGRNPSPLFNTSVYVKAHKGSVNPEGALSYFYYSGRLVAPGAYRSSDVLISLQRSYQARTNTECLRNECSGRKRFAVYLQCGAGLIHDCWLKDHSRLWDLIVNHYDGSYVGKIPCDLEFRQIGLEPGTKFTSFFTIITKWPHFIKDYDFIMLLDDDVVFEEDGISELFSFMKEYSVDLAQASLSSDSYCAHPILKNRASKGLRYTNTVEIMMPVLSKRALTIGRHLFGQTISGWGLDVALGKLVTEKLSGRAAVIDQVVAKHTKDIDVDGGEFYKMLHRASIYPEIELTNIQKIYRMDNKLIEEISIA